MATGIDIYTKYQRVTDWGRVRRAGYSFAYVKVSDGTGNRDDGGHGPAGRGAGLAMGGYHYAQPGDPVAQANRLVDRCAAAGLLDLAPALDIETPFGPGPAAERFATAFCQQVARRGHRPCIYGSDSMLRVILPAVRRAVPSVLVWVARYGARPAVTYDVWQHSSSGQVPGITASAVDLNTGAVPLNRSASAAEDIEEDELSEKAERAIFDILQQLTGSREPGPGTPGWNCYDGKKRTMLDIQRRILERLELSVVAGMYVGGQSTPGGRSLFSLVAEAAGKDPASFEISDEDAAGIAQSVLAGLPDDLARRIVDEEAARLAAGSPAPGAES